MVCILLVLTILLFKRVEDVAIIIIIMPAKYLENMKVKTKSKLLENRRNLNGILDTQELEVSPFGKIKVAIL